MFKKLEGNVAGSKLVHYGTAIDKSISKIQDAIAGIKNFYALRWKSFNEALGGGLEFGTTTTIGARSGVGKSTFVNLITNDIFELNSEIPTILLYWNFEVPSYKQTLKKISEHGKKSVKQLLRGESSLLFDNIEAQANNIKEKYKDKHFYFIDTSTNCENIKNVNEYFHKNKDFKDYKIVNILDHSRLITQRTKDINEEQKITGMYEGFVWLANNYGATNICISQLRKDYQNELDKGNYRPPGLGDIFGSDGIIQYSDCVVLMHRPDQNNKQFYSYEKIDNDELVKVRDEDTTKRIYLELAKQRNGMLGTVSLKQDLVYSVIYE